MSGYRFRAATPDDIRFLADAMISAEKSGTERPGLAALCGISEDELRELFVAMLQEEVDGCEYSVSSFLVAEYEGSPVAAVAAWIEGQPDGVPSKVLKANLLAFTLPPEHLKALQSHRDSMAGLQIERERGTLQIEYVHVDPAYRGKGLAGGLINEHVRRSLAADTAPALVQVQAYRNNAPALAAYERIGFRTVRTFIGTDTAMKGILPDTGRLLMERPSII